MRPIEPVRERRARLFRRTLAVVDGERTRHRAGPPSRRRLALTGGHSPPSDRTLIGHLRPRIGRPHQRAQVGPCPDGGRPDHPGLGHQHLIPQPTQHTPAHATRTPSPAWRTHASPRPETRSRVRSARQTPALAFTLACSEGRTGPGFTVNFITVFTKQPWEPRVPPSSPACYRSSISDSVTSYRTRDVRLSDVRDRSSALRQTSQVERASRLPDAITRFNRQLRQTRPMDGLTVVQMSALQSIEMAGAMTPREPDDCRALPTAVDRVKEASWPFAYDWERCSCR